MNASRLLEFQIRNGAGELGKIRAAVGGGGGGGAKNAG